MKKLILIVLSFSFLHADTNQYCSNLNNFTNVSDENLNNYKELLCNDKKEFFSLEEDFIDCKKSTKKILLIDKNITLKNQEKTIKNCNIIFKNQIFLENSNLNLFNNNIIALLGENDRSNASMEGPNAFLIVVKKSEKNIINMHHNNIYSLDNYSAGLIFSNAKKDYKDYSIYNIKDNTFNNLHGVLYINYFTGEIKNNNFLRNSFGNMVFSYTENISVENNNIYFPGNGTSGDGMTLSFLNNSTFKNNKIVGGSCYGIAVRGNNKNVKFIENLISDDITGALYFAPNTKGKNILIKNNLFLNNDSWAIAFTNNTLFSDLHISNNIFHKGNDTKLSDNLKYNVYISGTSKFKDITTENNLYFDPFLGKEKRIKNYTHVKKYNYLLTGDNK